MIWRSCERFGILPPGVKNIWEENDDWATAELLAYESIRQQEE